MPTSTVEDYVKQIYLTESSNSHRVPMGELAQLMEVVPGTATSMVKTLSDSGLVDYEPRGGVHLTEGGRKLALHVLRRHRLVELFLVRVLRLDWSEVHEEAEALEHVISDKVLERVDQVLGHPQVDPHGDPIPSATGTIATNPAIHETLHNCQAGEQVRIARILDQNPSFLQFIDHSGLTPGAEFNIEPSHPQADSVRLSSKENKTVTLGSSAAGKIMVEKILS